MKKNICKPDLDLGSIIQKEVAIRLLELVIHHPEIKLSYPSLAKRCLKVASEIEINLNSQHGIMSSVNEIGGVSRYWSPLLHKRKE